MKTHMRNYLHNPHKPYDTQPTPTPTAEHRTPILKAVLTQIAGRSKEGADPVTLAIMEDTRKRVEKGKRLYGEELHTHNNRNATRDLYEELLDALLYARQVQLEAGEDIPNVSRIEDYLLRSVYILAETKLGRDGLL